MNDLFAKYDIPAPRYTSYPTVPFWSESPTTEQWLQELESALQDERATWAIYLHLPFCETLCTFCACNTVITRDHGREETYLELLRREWSLYRERLPQLAARPLRQLHLGGGSPNFFAPENLKRMLTPLLTETQLDKEHFDASLEVDPRHTTLEQLRTLAELGFTGISLGVQDFNEEVQKLVNRHQPFVLTQRLTEQARALGYTSVNYDLIYGLPRQTLASIAATIRQTIELRPDRIALYSFALVPWIKPTQRGYKDEDLPTADEKRALYELARQMLLDAGYLEIGLDHFALPHDALSVAQRGNGLHRNFMGYTEARTNVLLGMGVSAISETPTCFHQNEKAFPVYERRLQAGELPTLRGHLLNAEDQARREQILQFMTQFKVVLTEEQEAAAPQFLQPLFEDGLVELHARELRLTERGRPFLRNATMFFDERLRRRRPQTRTCSQAL
ncbi:MAG: oxygen-independent coproporphyrinogen III oxidase [Acidobacteria bacterium]|nr:oxygen-independent coproporphyrinogen III oxidase [Acidobacteriota bacterium]MBI3424896.1 oxygen-independent coproporphyrinogen III oxidase [Acidobacteriota bacterium]